MNYQDKLELIKWRRDQADERTAEMVQAVVARARIVPR